VRRLVSEMFDYLSSLASTTRRAWNAFFFTPADPTPLGLMRVAAGLLAFWSLLVFGLDLNDYFSSRGWADPVVIRQSQLLRQPLAWSFWFLVPDSLLRPVWLVCLGVLGLYTAGLFSRITGVLAWVIVVSTVRRLPIALFGFDQVLSTLLFYLAITFSSGQAISLDRFLERWRQARAAARLTRTQGGGRRVSPGHPGAADPTISANLALRMIQLHTAFIYGMAGLAKVQGPSWWNGMALWRTMTAGEFVSLDFTALANWPLVLNFLTHASLALELLYPILIWISVLRPLVVVGMVGLHLGIAIVAPGLTEFGLAMIAANLAFVSGTWLRSLATGRNQPVLRVIFDGACPRCRATMAFLTAADPDHVVDPVDLTAVDVEALHPALTKKACMESMHVISRWGQVTAGFDGVRSLGAWLPVFWPLGLLAWMPGVAWVGRRVYNHLAATRPRDVPCNDEVCGIHPVQKKARAVDPKRRSTRTTTQEQVGTEESKNQ
jgi:predicted DCC family thiol-disulfide oxidoreductase YuxK